MSVRVVVCRRRVVGCGKLLAAEHGSQIYLTGNLHKFLCLALVLHTGQVDHDGVSLAQNLGLSNAKRVDALAQLLDCEIHALVAKRRARLGALRHRDAALQIETECRFRVSSEHRRQRAVGDDHDSDEGKN